MPPAGAKRRPAPKGLTFVELMVTLSILSVGLVMIYRSLFLAVDYQFHLLARLYADVRLEDRIARIEQRFKEYGNISFDLGPTHEETQIANRAIAYDWSIVVKPVDQLTGVYELDVIVSWNEGRRRVQVSRSAYISNLIALVS